MNEATLKEMEERKSTRHLSKDPNKAMQEMMSTIDNLRGALIEETNALKEADTKTFLTLQDKKLEVAREYLDNMAQMLARKEELQSADPTLKNKLEKMRAEFSETAHENHAALERMKNGMQRLGERIMEKAREAAKKEEELIYGSSGRMYSGIRASVGVSETA
jgi:ElaB/YqjD/DUF883 family membrane-anchored ribosome-binding protein